MRQSSEASVVPAIERKAAILIASGADRPPFIDLIFALNDFALRLSDVGREREDEITSQALLDRDSRGWVLIIPAEKRIDRQARNSSQFPDPAADLARQSFSQDLIRAEASGNGLLCGLPSGDQVDYVNGRQWRIGGVFCLQLFHRAHDCETQIVLLDGGGDENVEVRLGSRWICEIEETALKLISLTSEENIA